MKRLLLVILALIMTAGYVWAENDNEVDKLMAPDGHVPRKPSKPASGAVPDTPDSSVSAEDIHFVQHDDYFIAEQALGKEDYIYVNLAKMVTPPSTQTKGEGEFFKVTDGNKQWTKYFWKSRIAHKGDLKLGTVLIVFEGNSHDSIYQAPETKESARSANWFMPKVTDLTDLYKGYITVSGGYKVSPKNMRIIVK